MGQRKRLQKGQLIASTSIKNYQLIKKNLIIIFYKEVNCFEKKILNQIEIPLKINPI
jgi:hypothetical protein